MPLYSYHCDNEHTVDIVSSYKDRPNTVVCPECGGEAKYNISPSFFKLEGVTGAFPGAYYKWNKSHADRLKKERKANAP
jgi:putative FmdB family regulatory protein